MNSTDLLAQFRLDIVDTVEPQLWSDAELLHYIDDAQKMFCRLVGGIGDGSSALTVLPWDTTTDWLAVSPLILKFRDAWQVSDGQPIDIINYEDMAARGVRFDGRTGIPRVLVIGIEPGRARLYPFPSNTDTIQLIVDRLPLRTIDDVDEVLEVQDQHFTGLLLWAKSMAYDKQDADTFDRNKQQEFEGKFRAYCAAAKAEKDRAKHKTRVVVYGGGAIAGTGRARGDYGYRGY